MAREKLLKWGIMGAGIIARKMADALATSPYNTLHAIASKNPERARIFADEFQIENSLTYSEIVNDSEIDVIYVATTHNYHFENAKKALLHDKHVLVEKAFTVNARQAKELVQIARERKLFLMEAIWVRFLPSLIKLKQLLHNQAIGEPQVVTISFGGFVGPKYEKRLKDPALAGGVTLDMGIYPISFVCYILGEIPIEIKSMTKFSSLGVDEISHYMFRFPNGCIANISTSYNLKMKNLATIYGDKGYIEFPQFQTGEKFTLFKHNGTNDVQETISISENHAENGFIYQIDEVSRCIKNAEFESEIIPLDETVAIMEVMDTMREQWGFKYPFEEL